MKSLRKLLGSERGDMLIDSMFGAVIISIIMASSGSVMMAATTAATGNDATTTRVILLNTVLSDEKPNLANYTTTPQTINRTAKGQDIAVALWIEEPAPGVTVLNAATRKTTAPGAAADCSGPDRLDSSKCLSSRTVTTTSAAGVAIATVLLSPGTAGALHDFTAPAAATELRYIVKVTTAAGDSTLTFGNRDQPGVSHVVKIPSGQTGYFYGRILVDAGSHLFLAAAGPATIDSASTVLYEAPE